MADAADMVANLIGLLGTAYQLSMAICGAVNSIRAAPVHIKAVSSDTRAMFSVLGTLSSYLDDEENAMGVLHRVVAADLRDVLTNSISVLKELQMLVNEFIKGDRGEQNLAKWTSVRLHFKETDVKQWREQLVAHKITLSVAIAMANLVNTSSTDLATKRIEKEVLELKSMVTNLRIRLNATEELQADHDIIVDNYRSTIRRVTRGADSIISKATWERSTYDLPQSIVVSSTGVSEETGASYKTARSIVTAKLNNIRDEADARNTTDLISVRSLCNNETSRRNDEIKHKNHKSPFIDGSNTGRLHQVFVKGPNERTHAFTFECTPIVHEILDKIWERTGVPPERLSLRVSGRIITDRGAPLCLPDGVTIHANINAIGVGWGTEMWDDDDAAPDSPSLRYLPWYTRYLLKIKRPSSMYHEQGSFDNTFRHLVGWYDEHELRTQQHSFTLLAQGLRRIVAGRDMVKADTYSLDSGFWSAFSRKRSSERSSQGTGVMS